LPSRATRRAVFAGSWYAGSRESLWHQIEELFLGPHGPGRLPKLGERNDDLVGILSPHAGYLYSGQAAALAYYEVATNGPRDVVVLLGPNHRGVGSGIAISPSDSWSTPLGEVEVDLEIAKEISKRSGIADLDETAHRSEHSLEIQLPFLQYVFKDNPFKIVPISVWMCDLRVAKELGSSMADSLSGRNALLVASSDMTHYMPAEVASERDKRTLEQIRALDEEKTWKMANEFESLCGLGPVLSCMVAAKKLGAEKGEVLGYYTSGDITGDNSAVVGYSAVAFKKGSVKR